MTFDLWISPEELSALPTRLATKTWFAGALTCDLQERHVTKNNRSTNVERTSEKAFGLMSFRPLADTMRASLFDATPRAEMCIQLFLGVF